MLAKTIVCSVNQSQCGFNVVACQSSDEIIALFCTIELFHFIASSQSIIRFNVPISENSRGIRSIDEGQLRIKCGSNICSSVDSKGDSLRSDQYIESRQISFFNYFRNRFCKEFSELIGVDGLSSWCTLIGQQNDAFRGDVSGQGEGGPNDSTILTLIVDDDCNITVVGVGVEREWF